MSVKAVAKKAVKPSPEKVMPGTKVMTIVLDGDQETLLRELEITRQTFQNVSCELSKGLETCVYVMGH